MQANYRQETSRRSGVARIILTALLIGAPAATMACSISADSRMRFDAISTTRDAPVGTTLGPVETSQVTVDCNANPNPAGDSAGYELRLYPALPLSSTVPNVWQTTTPGVGIRVVNTTENMPLSTSASGSYTLFAPILGQTARSRQSYVFSYQLVKTGPITPSTGRVAQQRLYDLYSYNRRTGVRSRFPEQVNMNSVNFAARSCAMTTQAITKRLMPIGQSRLIINGIGNLDSFSLNLSCPDTTVTIFVTMTDYTNPANRSDILSLTPESTARGVGLRIRRRGTTPVFYGPDSAEAGNENQWAWSLGSSSGLSSLPMTVEYVRTGRVRGGSVHAIASFTFSYQ